MRGDKGKCFQNSLVGFSAGMGIVRAALVVLMKVSLRERKERKKSVGLLQASCVQCGWG